MATDISDMRLLLNPLTGILVSNLQAKTIISGLDRLLKVSEYATRKEQIDAYKLIKKELSVERMFHEYNKLVEDHE